MEKEIVLSTHKGEQLVKKKILMIHNYYQIGGGEHTVFENEVEMLRKNGNEVITYSRSNDELKTSRLKLILVPFTTIWSFKSYFQVKKIIKENKIDIVHCHNTFPLISPSVYYAARSLKVPVVQTIHNFRFLCPAGIFYREGQICEKCITGNSLGYAIKNKCYRNSKIQTLVAVTMLKLHRMMGTYKKISYIFLTEFNKTKFDKLIDISGENVYVKPNFVNRVSIGKASNTKEIKFVFAGRLEENKGLDFLLKVWPYMPKDYQLHIYGDGTLKAETLQADKTCENIKYYGFRPQKDIFNDLSGAKALLFPSNCYETFGMTVAEAFSMGVPSITTNIGNPGDIVSSANGGTLFECNDKETFELALKEIVKNNDVYSKNGKKYYDVFLNEEYNYERLIEIYDRAKHIN